MYSNTEIMWFLFVIKAYMYISTQSRDLDELCAQLIFGRQCFIQCAQKRISNTEVERCIPYDPIDGPESYGELCVHCSF